MLRIVPRIIAACILIYVRRPNAMNIIRSRANRWEKNVADLGQLFKKFSIRQLLPSNCHAVTMKMLGHVSETSFVKKKKKTVEKCISFGWFRIGREYL